MGFFGATVVVLLAPPALMAGMALAENLRAGQLAQVRRLCGGRLAPSLARALVNATWSLWLTALALPLGRFLGPKSEHVEQTPVILVHGLYHNPAAWLVFGTRLATHGLTHQRSYAYSSFGPGFAEIVQGLAQTIREVAETAPAGRVLLVGHSLGGLVIRAACAEPEIASLVAGVVTLGAPHRGSTLANLAIGRLGRALIPEGEVLTHLQGLPVCRARALSLSTPTDSMVLPLACAFLEEREKAAGWREACVAPMSHVGLLYDAKTAAIAAEFLRECTRGEEPEKG
jgi:triacylglycerol esterase/lipase EstA (alpha/beta hydrolase family)